MMKTVTGVVENKRKDGKGIQVGGNWYSVMFSYNLDGVAKGDEVEFNYTEKANPSGGNPYLNIKGTPTKKTPAASKPVTASSMIFGPRASGGGYVTKEFPVPPLHPDRSIVRQNSLTHAVSVVNYSDDCNVLLSEDRAARVIEIARMFEAYSCGDLDREMVDAEVKLMLAKEAH